MCKNTSDKHRGRGGGVDTVLCTDRPSGEQNSHTLLLRHTHRHTHTSPHNELMIFRDTDLPFFPFVFLSSSCSSACSTLLLFATCWIRLPLPRLASPGQLGERQQQYAKDSKKVILIPESIQMVPATPAVCVPLFLPFVFLPLENKFALDFSSRLLRSCSSGVQVVY